MTKRSESQGRLECDLSLVFLVFFPLARDGQDKCCFSNVSPASNNFKNPFCDVSGLFLLSLFFPCMGGIVLHQLTL